MYNAIEHYMEVLRKKGINNIYGFSSWAKEIENIDPALKQRFDAGEIFVKRQEHSNFEVFWREVGYPLPKDIADFLNTYWQPGIFGYYKDLPACFMLFSALRNKDEGPDDFLLRQGAGLIAEAKRWVSYGGDIDKYLPIGIYDAYSTYFLLYEIKTGRIFIEDFDNEGIPESEPVADSLRELICGLYFPCTNAERKNAHEAESLSAMRRSGAEEATGYPALMKKAKYALKRIICH